MLFILLKQHTIHLTTLNKWDWMSEQRQGEQMLIPASSFLSWSLLHLWRLACGASHHPDTLAPSISPAPSSHHSLISPIHAVFHPAAPLIRSFGIFAVGCGGGPSCSLVSGLADVPTVGRARWLACAGCRARRVTSLALAAVPVM